MLLCVGFKISANGLQLQESGDFPARLHHSGGAAQSR